MSLGGGEAYDMGDESNFVFAVKSYRPPYIRCANTPPASRPVSKSCQTILNTMKASTGTTRSGVAGLPDVDEHLPQFLTERK